MKNNKFWVWIGDCEVLSMWKWLSTDHMKMLMYGMPHLASEAKIMISSSFLELYKWYWRAIDWMNTNM
jgi:hypothetical protein